MSPRFAVMGLKGSGRTLTDVGRTVEAIVG